ncbi:bifunctional DNA primase/polymerase [bacterium]|nr:bifunctional DNA primase/polymerase [bacterium]
MNLVAPLALTETEGALDFALLYAGLGWRVFPLHSMQDGACSCGNTSCTSPGKHPRTKRGCKDATTDERRIRAWWKRWPDANVAIATGQGSGLVVIDVDPRHGGDDSWETLQHELELPATWEVRTGGGGVHAYFSYPEGAAITIGASVLGPGVDHRGNGGYVVAPPSNHASGGTYFWDVLEGEPLAELPDALVQRLLPAEKRTDPPASEPATPAAGPPWWAVLRRVGFEPEEIAAIGERLDDPLAARAASLYEPGDRRLPETLPDGQRHDLCVKLAGLLRRAGVADNAVEATLDLVATRRMKPPWEDKERQDEIRQILRSTSRWARERVRWPRPSIRGIAGVLTSGDGDLADILQDEHVQQALRRVGRDGWDMLQLRLADAGLKRDAVAAVRSVVIPRRESGPADRDRDRRPWIYAQEGDLTVITPKAWDAVRACNDPPRLFLCEGSPVRLAFDDDDTPQLEELTSTRMRHEIARAAHFYVHVNDRAMEVLPPRPLVDDVLAVQAPPIPPLRRIVEVPVFSPDGTLQTRPGYHPAGRTFYAPREGFELPDVPERPGPREIQRAKAWIDEILTDFPFVSAADKAHAVALFVLPYVRDLIGADPTPGHLIEAPTPGSGKSLLADVATYPFAGRAVSTVTEARDDDEWRKRLTAQLKERRAVIVLDNLVRPLDSGALSSALTTAVWEDRILGKNETIRVPVRCVWVATGNNVTLSTELARRFIRIRIDPRMDRPFQREGFRHNPLRSWVHRHRADLVWAALVLAQGWISAGSPKTTSKPLGSYERWSRVVGGILEHAEIPGFLANVNELYEAADHEGALWRTFVAAWWDQHRDQEVTSKELFEIAEGIDGLVSTRGNDKSQRTSFGKKLGKQHDRVFGEYQVVSTGTRKRAKVWRLINVASTNKEGVNVAELSTERSPQRSPCGTTCNDSENGPSEDPKVNMGERSHYILNARGGSSSEDRDLARVRKGCEDVHPRSPDPTKTLTEQGVEGGERLDLDVHPRSPSEDDSGATGQGQGADPADDQADPSVAGPTSTREETEL